MPDGVAARAAAVPFEGGLEDAYRVRLGSRVAGRLLAPIGTCAAPSADALYEGLRDIAWAEHLPRGATFAVRVTLPGRGQENAHFWALKAKDAVVDVLRDVRGGRPDIDTRDPDVGLFVHVHEDVATVHVDAGGGPLHRRGYRARGAAAPLRETLAAGLLRAVGGHTRLPEGAPLVDLTCGSGTLLIEGALMALGIAPGMLRERDPRGPGRWLGHDAAGYRRVRASLADARRESAGPIVGYDIDRDAARAAREAVTNAGLEEHIRVVVRDLRDAKAPDGPAGIVITNPPYGERLGELGGLGPLYEAIGDTFKRQFPGYTAAVYTGNLRAAKSVGLRPSESLAVRNGPIDGRLSVYPIRDIAPTGDSPSWRRVSAEAEPFRRRLEKNLKRLDAWAKADGLEAYRLYDAEIPEFNVTIERYGDEVVIAEYRRPHSVPVAKAEARLRDVRLVTAELLGLDDAQLHLRERARGPGQYERRQRFEETSLVREGPHRFEVNLRDYLDVGLFLDHRKVRRVWGKKSQRALNLFAYTCTASVYAADQGAHVTSVDLSGRYLDWGERNFAHNGLDPRSHAFVRDDVTRFLQRASGRWDAILLNPPSFSRSKRMEGDFDVKRDHPELLELAMGRLNPEGALYFTTHARGFELDEGVRRRYRVHEQTKKLTPRDMPSQPFVGFLIRHLEGRRP